MITRLLILISFLLVAPAGARTSSYLIPPPQAPATKAPAAEVKTEEIQTPPAQGDLVAEPAEDGAETGLFQSPSYRLILRDQIQMTVYGQPDLTVAQRIDGEGTIRIPLLGNVVIAGKTVRELEDELEKAFIDGEFLRSPMVTVRVTEYAPREITVFGAVRSPGALTLPIEVNSIDIVELISKVGGFTPVAKTKEVRVVRNRGQTDERVEIIDVAGMIAGQNRSRQKQVQIHPGDLIQVDQSLF